MNLNHNQRVGVRNSIQATQTAIRKRSPYPVNLGTLELTVFQVLVEEVNSSEWVVWVSCPQEKIILYKIFLTYRQKDKLYPQGSSIGKFYSHTASVGVNLGSQNLLPICTVIEMRMYLFSSWSSKKLNPESIVRRRIKEIYGL